MRPYTKKAHFQKGPWQEGPLQKGPRQKGPWQEGPYLKKGPSPQRRKGNYDLLTFVLKDPPFKSNLTIQILMFLLVIKFLVSV